MIYGDIIGTNKTYYKAGDTLDPVTTEQFFVTAGATQNLTAGDYLRWGEYFLTCNVQDYDEEGLYTVDRWWIDNSPNSYYAMPDGVTIEFYVLKQPKLPVVGIDIVEMTATVNWSCASLGIRGVQIDWGDGTSEFIVPSTASHTYLNKGAYQISVTAINECDMQSSPKVTTIIVGEGLKLVKHNTIYLLNNMKIVKPINTTYRIIFNTFNTTATFTMPYDPAIKCGMQIYLYHMFPQLFVIESISGERTISVSCVDYLTALLRGRVAYTGTTLSEDGYVTYTGNAVEQILNIINDNLIPSPRGDLNMVPQPTTMVATDISIKARYNQVSSILENAMSQSGLVLTSTIIFDSPLLIKYDLQIPKTVNVLFDSRRLCGEMQSRTWVRKATTALVAGAGSGAERETEWRGDLVSSGSNRVETYIDGGDSTETNALEIQKGDNMIWKLSSNSPYKPYRDFWVGDKIYIDETTTMTITQIDFSKSTNGESFIITLGYPCDGIDKTVLDMQTGITQDYR